MKNVHAEAGMPVPIVETLPTPIGASPFRAKGHLYEKMKENVGETVPGGLDAFLERLEDRELAKFFAQRFLTGSWYDALPMMPLAVTHSRVLGNALHYHCRERGRIVAERDVPGVYRAFLKLVSPELLVGKLPRAAALYFDFGHTTSELVPPGRARTRLSRLPFTLATMLAGTVEGFMAAALELCGGKDVQVRTLDVTFDGGVVAGIPTAAIRHEASWRR